MYESVDLSNNMDLLAIQPKKELENNVYKFNTYLTCFAISWESTKCRSWIVAGMKSWSPAPSLITKLSSKTILSSHHSIHVLTL